jgi:alanyl-tRNA synthetase
MHLDPRTRLYLDDANRLEFDAEIVERLPLADGALGLVLDRTAFYPTSGGQPHDTGRLEDAAVLDVVEMPDGRIVHRVEHDPGATRVHGRVDAARRRDHMQQHSGQHLLSATCLALLQRETLSFHLGEERCSIDLPGEPLEAQALDAVERRANDIVWEARPVRARFVAAGELAALRKSPPTGLDRVRVIEIESWDANACCGTHVSRTSEIGWIKLLGSERLGRGTRLAFVCGGRALAEAGRMQRRQDELVRLLTCHPDALVGQCSKLLQDAKAERKERDRLAGELAAARAGTWLAAAPAAAGVPVVVRAVDGGPAALRPACEALVAGGAIALLAARDARAEFLFQRPAGLEVDLRPAMQAACAAVGGKGGGAPSRVQGSGPHGDRLESALQAARAVVLSQLGVDPAGF